MMERPEKNTTGFTLVEVLVVMAIFGVILAGVVKVYEVSNRSYMVQQDMAAMQQNIRAAKMFLERDVLMAACGFGTSFGNSGNQIYGIDFSNGGTSGTDSLTITYIDYGEDGCDNLLPQITLSGTLGAGSTQSTVNENLNTGSNADWADLVKVCGATNYGTVPFKAIITDANSSQSEVVEITAVNKGLNQLTHNGILNTYQGNSAVNFFNEDKLEQITYDVVNSVLRRNSQPLAEDIEDLQFAFGLDTNGDGTVNQTIAGLDLNGTQKGQVRWVRINILGRTASQHRGFTGSRPAIEDHTAAGTTDGYRRKQLTFTVKVRNLGL